MHLSKNMSYLYSLAFVATEIILSWAPEYHTVKPLGTRSNVGVVKQVK